MNVTKELTNAVVLLFGYVDAGIENIFVKVDHLESVANVIDYVDSSSAIYFKDDGFKLTKTMANYQYRLGHSKIKFISRHQADQEEPFRGYKEYLVLDFPGDS